VAELDDLVDDTIEPAENSNASVDDVESPSESVSLSDAVKAKWTTSTTKELMQGFSIGRFDVFTEKEEDLDVNQELDDLQITDPEERKLFSDVKTREELDNALAYRQELINARETLQNTGAVKSAIATVIAGVADPINATITAAAFFTAGGSIAVGAVGALARSAFAGSLLGAIDSTVEQRVLEGNVKANEVVKNAVAGAIVAPIAEAGMNAVSKAVKPQMLKGFNALKKAFAENLTPALETPTVQEFKLKLERLAFQIKSPSPILQTINSKDPLVQKFGTLVFESPLNKDLTNDVAIETELKLFSSYDTGIAKEKFLENAQNFIKDGQTLEDFNVKVAKALVSGEKTDNSYVNNAVDALMRPTKKVQKADVRRRMREADIKANRFVLNDKLQQFTADELENMSMINLEENGISRNTAHNYAKRFYNEELKTNKDLQKKALDLIQKEVALNNNAGLRNAINEGVSFPKLTKEEMQDVSYTILANISGTSPQVSGRTPVSAIQSFIRSREVAISDTILYEQGIIKFDVDKYLQSLNKLYAESLFDQMAKKHFEAPSFEDFFNSLKKQKQQDLGAVIKQDLNLLKEAEEADYNYKLIGDIYDIFTGNYSGLGAFKNNSIIKKIANQKTVIAMGSLGNVFLAAITDLAKPLVRFEFGRLLKAYSPFKSDLRKESKETLLKFVGLSARMRSQGGSGYITTIGEWGHDYTYYINKVSGMSLLETSVDGAVLQMQYSDLIKACISENKTPQMLSDLARFGINEDYAKIIAKAFKDRGHTYGSELYVDPVHIKNKDCVRRLQGSLRALADDITYKQSVGNTPRFMQSEIGSILFMFKKYGYQLYTHLYAPLMNGRISKIKATEALVASVSLAVLEIAAKNALNNKDTDFTSADFWKEVFDYSDFNTHVTDTLITAINTGFGSHFQGLSGMSPFTSYLDRTIRNIQSILKGRPDWKGIANSVPWVNLWYLRPLTSRLNDGKSKLRRKRI